MRIHINNPTLITHLFSVSFHVYDVAHNIYHKQFSMDMCRPGILHPCINLDLYHPKPMQPYAPIPMLTRHMHICPCLQPPTHDLTLCPPAMIPHVRRLGSMPATSLGFPPSYPPLARLISPPFDLFFLFNLVTCWERGEFVTCGFFSLESI